MNHNRKLHTITITDAKTRETLMKGETWHVDVEDAVAYGQQVAGREFPAYSTKVSAFLSNTVTAK